MYLFLNSSLQRRIWNSKWRRFGSSAAVLTTISTLPIELIAMESAQ